jgi:hypothetical protein
VVALKKEEKRREYSKRVVALEYWSAVDLA